ncbi:MAG: hypothetical protein SGBAC_002429 [Bacillariaceae sp.]
MVILETAAIGAAGYGVYRGGEESAKKAKQAKKEYKFGQKLRGNRNELSSKSKERNEKIAQLNMMRSARNDSSMASAGSGSADSAWPLGGTSSSRTPNNSTSSLPPDDDTSVKDRQKAVMDKLNKNKPKQKKSLFGMFKKDKK